MKISTSTFNVFGMCGTEDGLQILANAGFEAIDYSLTDKVAPWDQAFLQDAASPEFAAYFRETAAAIRRYGISIHQCHAPYASTVTKDFETFVSLQDRILRAVYATGYMGCPNIVVHPVQLPEFCNGQNREKALQMSLDYFGSMAPALRESGVTMCIENLFFTESRGLPKISNYCSDAGSLNELIDALNAKYGPYFAACLDTGHALLVGEDPCEMLKALGHRLRVLHINDNTRGTKDEHLIPSAGTINWKEFAEVLGETDYQGTFNFEVIPHYRNLPRDTYSRDVFQNACNLLYSIGRSLADIAERTPRAEA